MITDLIDLIFPPRCSACEESLTPGDQFFCTHCWSQLKPYDLQNYSDHLMDQHFWGRVRVEATAALFPYYPKGLVQQVIHNIKYRGDKRLGRFCGEWLGHLLKEAQNFQSVDAILPVPLFRKRMRNRGYNQSQLIAKGISKVMKLPVIENGLSRSRSTASQTSFNRFERIKNMESAFHASPNLAAYNHLLLIDDVVTTGATLEACIRAIRRMESQEQVNAKISLAALALGG